MMHNFVADVRKGIDLLKSFEQSNLLNNMACVLSHTNRKRGKVQHLHVQIVCMRDFYNPVY